MFNASINRRGRGGQVNGTNANVYSWDRRNHRSPLPPTTSTNSTAIPPPPPRTSNYPDHWPSSYYPSHHVPWQDVDIRLPPPPLLPSAPGQFGVPNASQYWNYYYGSANETSWLNDGRWINDDHGGWNAYGDGDNWNSGSMNNTNSTERPSSLNEVQEGHAVSTNSVEHSQKKSSVSNKIVASKLKAKGITKLKRFGATCRAAALRSARRATPAPPLSPGASGSSVAELGRQSLGRLVAGPAGAKERLLLQRCMHEHEKKKATVSRFGDRLRSLAEESMASEVLSLISQRPEDPVFDRRSWQPPPPPSAQRMVEPGHLRSEPPNRWRPEPPLQLNPPLNTSEDMERRPNSDSASHTGRTDPPLRDKRLDHTNTRREEWSDLSFEGDPPSERRAKAPLKKRLAHTLKERRVSPLLEKQAAKERKTDSPKELRADPQDQLRNDSQKKTRVESAKERRNNKSNARDLDPPRERKNDQSYERTANQSKKLRTNEPKQKMKNVPLNKKKKCNSLKERKKALKAKRLKNKIARRQQNKIVDHPAVRNVVLPTVKRPDPRQGRNNGLESLPEKSSALRPTLELAESFPSSGDSTKTLSLDRPSMTSTDQVAFTFRLPERVAARPATLNAAGSVDVEEDQANLSTRAVIQHPSGEDIRSPSPVSIQLQANPASRTPVLSSGDPAEAGTVSVRHDANLSAGSPPPVGVSEPIPEASDRMVSVKVEPADYESESPSAEQVCPSSSDSLDNHSGIQASNPIESEQSIHDNVGASPHSDPAVADGSPQDPTAPRVLPVALSLIQLQNEEQAIIRKVMVLQQQIMTLQTHVTQLHFHQAKISQLRLEIVRQAGRTHEGREYLEQYGRMLVQSHQQPHPDAPAAPSTPQRTPTSATWPAPELSATPSPPPAAAAEVTQPSDLSSPPQESSIITATDHQQPESKATRPTKRTKRVKQLPEVLVKVEPEMATSPVEVASDPLAVDDALPTETSKSGKRKAKTKTPDTGLKKRKKKSRVPVVPVDMVVDKLERPTKLVWEFFGHTDKIVKIKIFKGSLFSCSIDGTAKQFDLLPGAGIPRCVMTYSHQCRSAIDLDVATTNKEDRCLIVASTSGGLQKFNMENGDQFGWVATKNPITCFTLKWSLIFIGDDEGQVTVYKVSSLTVLKSFSCSQNPVRCLATTAEGACRILCTGCEDGTITLRDARSGLLLRCLSEDSRSPLEMHVANQLIFSRRNSGGSMSRDILIHTMNGESVEHVSQMLDVTVISVDGELLYMGSRKGLVRVVNVRTKAPMPLYYGVGREPIAAILCQNQLVVTGNAAGKLEAFQIGDGKVVYICKFGRCKNPFAFHEDLARHVDILHLSTLPDQCLVADCGYSFVSTEGQHMPKETILTHILSHTDQDQ